MVFVAGAEGKLEQAGQTLGIPVFNIPYHQKLLGEDCEAYMGLADASISPFSWAFEKSDLVIMVGARLDNQMNFGNPPLFPNTTDLLCVNGSHEELDLNRSADFLLLCDPGVFLDALIEHAANQNFQLSKHWFMENRAARSHWVKKMLDEVDKEASELQFGGRIHPLHLALDVQAAMDDGNWLVIDGGNTHFWSEIAINIAGFNGKKLGGILHPGTFSLLGVGVSFALAAKKFIPSKTWF